MTSLFSRVRLNPTRRGTRALLASAQSLHAIVMGSHPLGTSSNGARVLWRLDRPASHELELFVVSPTRPDFTGLVEQAGWPTLLGWDTTEYEPFLDRLARGQRWRFRLTANPVRSRAAERGRGKVSPHRTVQYQVEWLESRCTGWGFTIPDSRSGAPAVSASNRHTDQFIRTAEGDSGPQRTRVSITRCDFTGVLEIGDAELLRRCLVHGMGRAKAYGCGLMTLAPL